MRAEYPSQLDYSGCWLQAARRGCLQADLGDLGRLTAAGCSSPGSLLGPGNLQGTYAALPPPGLNISGFVHLPQAPNAHREAAGGNSWDALRLCLGAGLMRDACWPDTWRIQGVHKAYIRRKQRAYKAYTRCAHGRHKAQSLHIQAVYTSTTGTLLL